MSAMPAEAVSRLIRPMLGTRMVSPGAMPGNIRSASTMNGSLGSWRSVNGAMSSIGWALM